MTTATHTPESHDIQGWATRAAELEYERDRLRSERQELKKALQDCMSDIESLMADFYGAPAIMPFSHDRATALLERMKP